MATEYKLKYTGQEIDNKLDQVGTNMESISRLSEEIVDQRKEMVKSVNGFEPDENGEVIIQYEATTEKDYRHSDLSKSSKTIKVYANDKYTNEPYVFLGKNYFPMSENVSNGSGFHSFSIAGMRYDTDKHNITLKGTATASDGFYLHESKESSHYWELPSDLVPGDEMSLYVFSVLNTELRCPSLRIYFFDENKTQVGTQKIQVAVGQIQGGPKHFLIPDNTVYVAFRISFSSGETHDNTIFPVWVKRSTENQILSFVDGVATYVTENETTDICTAPYESTVTNSLELSKYIDSKSNGSSVDVDMVRKLVSFVTPEMFGAYGDGNRDDTVALQNCIDYAIENGKRAICSNSYRTSEPIEITGDNLSIEIRQIKYFGTEHAVRLNGSRNCISIVDIYSEGTGVIVNSDIASSYNDIRITSLNVKKTGTLYSLTNGSIVGNRLTFSRITAGQNYNCIECNPEDRYNGKNMSSNSFVGGVVNRGRWGVYGAKECDTFTTIQFEGVDNAIFTHANGGITVISPRLSELKNEAFDTTLPNRPKKEGYGVIFKIAVDQSQYENNTSADSVCSVEFVGDNRAFYPLNFDLTDAMLMDSRSGDLIAKGTRYVHKFKNPLNTRMSVSCAHEFLIFGNHILIKDPWRHLIKHITSADVGYLGDYTETDVDDEFIIYSEFVIDEADCEYTLPPSYDWIAFNRFEVHQAEGTSCTFRDWRGTIVFDGATLGAGRYDVRVRLADGKMDDYYDNRNQVWDIYKNGELVATMPLTI